MDAKTNISEQFQGQGFHVTQFKSAELSIFSYIVHSNQDAILLDPTFDVKVYNDYLIQKGLTLKAVFLSHYHADFLSGHTQFNVPIVMGPNAKRAINSFEVKEFKDLESFELGAVKLQIIHTPGHTEESSCFLLSDSNNVQVACFSGDTVFLGQVGRPDLACTADTTVEDLAGMLYDSIEKLKKLPKDIKLFPGHGSGSACGKAIGAGNSCNFQNQHIKNYGFSFAAKEQFIEKILENLPRPPRYFFHDAKLNQTGAGNYIQHMKTANNPLKMEQFAVLSNKVPVVDTRLKPEGIIKGSYWLSSSGTIVNWLANLLKPDQKFIIICEESKHQDIIDRFFRIGYFGILGYNAFPMSQWKDPLIKPEILTFQSLKELKEYVILDVRNRPEYESAGVVAGSILIPLPELEHRVEELRQIKNIVVHCRTGLRGKAALSILAKHGIQSKALVENFQKFKENGLDIIPHLNHPHHQK